ncbi:ABC transporter substrate-binding protein [Portibacter marinus]|uniref:ABC transporter substrate-binding protein n=1 Tax=Portibacter marinus TaxID=2898660 RepID=UPI001F369274|nr:ABC transporter substrate-binding protein [Portibacter marinus]
MKYVVFIFVLLYACSPANHGSELDISTIPWQEIEQKASGTTVNFMMWQGSPSINSYINNYVIPAVKEKYNIDLKITGGQGPEIVQLIMGEKQANVGSGQVDMVWINGETFFQLRQIDGLWGPFVTKLPNAQYVNFEDEFIGIDFQQPVNYMEAPWSVSQFALFYDTTRIQDPPSNLDELESYVKSKPGTFTISNDFSGMTLLKSFLAELGGGPESLNGPFDKIKYQELSTQLWSYINKNKKHFWKNGTTFPKEHTKMDQMYANGELLIDYGFGEGGIEDKVIQGLFPKSTRGYAWDNGTIKNSNYLGISYNSQNKLGAMVVINFLMSPEAQLKKSDPNEMDSNTILDVSKLPVEWRTKFEAQERRKYGPEMADLQEKAIQEPDPQYMIRLFEDFRTQVIEQ